MGVKSFIKQLLCDDYNNITINSSISGLVYTGIAGTLIYAFFYLPYAIIYHGNENATPFMVIMGVIGVISWLLFAMVIIECIKNFFEIYGDTILFTWR